MVLPARKNILFRGLAIALLCFCQEATAKGVSEKSLVDEGFEQIIDRYLFIGDFAEKPAERPVYEEIIWKYPLKLAPQTFTVDLIEDDLDKMVFAVPGEGRLAEHFARGRIAFLEDRLDEAHATWLSARMKFDKDPITVRRLEFFLGVNAAKALLKDLPSLKSTITDSALKQRVNRATYFLAAAFMLRRDIKDPAIDRHAPWAIYNLAVMYYLLERWSLVAGAAQEGLTVLLNQGRKEYRTKFRQLLAEIFIKAQDPLTAIQELDTALRQDRSRHHAARIFNRAGDVYFGLNNYELAEDVYGTAARVDQLQRSVTPTSLAMRGESLFWLGKPKEAREILTYAAQEAVKLDQDWLLTSGNLPWIKLRIADSLLVETRQKKTKSEKDLEAVKLAYFRVESEHPTSESARIARLRNACLELPAFEGNNVKHARDILIKSIDDPSLPKAMNEMIEGCYVLSFTERERSDTMVGLVKKYADKYPKSPYLEKMLPAVKDVKAKTIDDFFSKGFDFLATEFFEKRRATLYEKVDDKLAAKLFEAYVNISQSSKAKEFYAAYQRESKKESLRSDEDLLRQLVFLAETVGSQDSGKNSLQAVVSNLKGRSWTSSPTEKSAEFVRRVLSAKPLSQTLPVIYEIASVWSKDDSDALCDAKLPLLIRMDQVDRRRFQKIIRNDLESVMSVSWPETATRNASCAQSLLDLESKVYTRRELKKIYEDRPAWKLESMWLDRVWTFSEDLHKNKDTDAARLWWNRIAKDAPASSFEAKMAKLRLDPQKTEVESLFGQ